jgi:nucleoside-diphosphate-sugar epimerase
MNNHQPEPLIVLSGAAGALGVPVHQALLAAGKRVRAVDRIHPFDRERPVIQADLSYPKNCRRILKDAEVLVHLAYYRKDLYPTPKSFQEHLQLNTELFQAACDAGVKKIIFASSIQVIALQTPDLSAKAVPLGLPLNEQSPPQPDNWYSLAKRCSEEMLSMLQRMYGIDCCIFRFPALTNRGLRENEVWFEGRLSEGFSYLTYRDAADLTLKAIEAKLPGYRVYIPASKKNGLGRPVPEIIREYYEGVPLNNKPLHEMEALVDFSSLTRDTGWEPGELSLEEAMPEQSRIKRLKASLVRRVKLRI